MKDLYSLINVLFCPITILVIWATWSVLVDKAETVLFDDVES